jgi:hypothetical protein
MKRVLFFAAVISSVVFASTTFASQPRTARNEVGATRNGPVAKLIELERRKNEWLRQRMGR